MKSLNKHWSVFFQNGSSGSYIIVHIGAKQIKTYNYWYINPRKEMLHVEDIAIDFAIESVTCPNNIACSWIFIS